MILNLSSNQSCGACEDTGLIVLGGTYRVGRRIMQPQATGCIWCEAGAQKFRIHPGMTAEYGLDDIEAPQLEPDLSNPRVRAACEQGFQEWKRAWRSMQSKSIERDRELRDGAPQTATEAIGAGA